MDQIQKLTPAITTLCRNLGVVQLDLFGSVVTEAFHNQSDVDVLVRFDPKGGDLFNRYFTLKEELERLFGRPVDLITITSVSNPYFQQSIEASRINVYTAEDGRKRLSLSCQAMRSKRCGINW